MSRLKLSFGFLLLLLAFACDTTSNITPPDSSYFLKYYGGDGNQYAVDLIVNSDGTFYILGNSRKTESDVQKIFIAKTDAFGKLIWQKTYGTVESDARDFILTSDGKLVIVANVLSATTGMDVLLLRATVGKDSITSTESATLQVEAAVADEYANSVTELSDGGFLVVGSTNYGGKQREALHLRTTSSLVQLTVNGDAWREVTGNGNYNYATNAFVKSPSAPNDFYIFGYNDFRVPKRFWVFGLGSTSLPSDNSDGSSEFTPGQNSEDILTSTIKVSPGYFMAGVTTNTLSGNISLKAINLRNDILSFSGSDIQHTYATGSLGKAPGIKQTIKFATACNSSSGYYLLSNTYITASGESDMILVKLSNDLEEVWSSPVLLGGEGEDTAAAVAELPDGRVMVLGTMNIGNRPEQFKIALMKLNPAGRLSN